MRIEHLEIENFRAIKHAKFDFHPRLNIFAGENGVGKSTILSVLSIMLSTVTNRLTGARNPYIKFSEGDIRRGTEKIFSRILVSIYGEKCEWEQCKDISNSVPTRRDLINLFPLLDAIKDDIRRSDNASIPLVAYYSATRSALDITLRPSKKPIFNQLAALSGSTIVTFEDLFEWFRNREDLENERFRVALQMQQLTSSKLMNFKDPQLEAVRKAIQFFLPDFTNIRVKRDGQPRLVVDKGEVTFFLEEFSDGEKGLLTLVADMARRIAMANPFMQNPLEGEAVFLIDEVELHLHPLWQRTVIPTLLETFPNSQFFITTHSPQVLGEIEDTESIWVMKNGEQPIHPSRAYGLDSNEILSELMGAPDRSSSVQKQLDEIDMLINDDKFNEARNLIRALAQKTKDIPALHSANAMLTMLGEEQVELVED